MKLKIIFFSLFLGIAFSFFPFDQAFAAIDCCTKNSECAYLCTFDPSCSYYCQYSATIAKSCPEKSSCAKTGSGDSCTGSGGTWGGWSDCGEPETNGKCYKTRRCNIPGIYQIAECNCSDGSSVGNPGVIGEPCPAGQTYENSFTCRRFCNNGWQSASDDKCDQNPCPDTGAGYSQQCCKKGFCVGTVMQCDDGLDNDGDGKIDFPNDPGCDDAWDNDETDVVGPPKCSDGLDNDGDGLIDFPIDPGCTDPNDNDENDLPPPPPECSDGVDNDGSGDIDFPQDKDCTGPDDDSEDPARINNFEITNFRLQQSSGGTNYYQVLKEQMAINHPNYQLNLSWSVTDADTCRASCRYAKIDDYLANPNIDSLPDPGHQCFKDISGTNTFQGFVANVLGNAKVKPKDPGIIRYRLECKAGPAADTDTQDIIVVLQDFRWFETIPVLSFNEVKAKVFSSWQNLWGNFTQKMPRFGFVINK